MIWPLLGVNNMRIYLSSIPPRVIDQYLAIFPDARLNILVSIALRNGNSLEYTNRLKSKFNSLILDSGAFTLNNIPKVEQVKCKVKVSIEQYRDHLRYFGHHFDYVFSFDRHFHDDGLADNMVYHKMLEGLHPRIVPVVHDYQGEDANVFIGMKEPLIALGYSTEQKTEKNIAAVSKKLHGAGKLVHALGVSNYARLINNPIAFCDSTTWNQPGQWRVLTYWSESKADDDKTEKIFFKDWAITTKRTDPKKDFLVHEKKEEITEHLKIFGYKENDLAGESNMDKRIIVQIHYYQKLQEVITANHVKLGWNFPF